jgi:PucR C-terminal helix-turn-helix domain/GGDEF-like domain
VSSQLRSPPSSDKRARAALLAQLRAQREQIEQAIQARVYSVSEPAETADPGYVEGLRMAVSAALDHGLAAVEHGEERSAPIPAVLLVQARLAARNGVSLDTVLRRYFAGYSVLSDFIMREADKGEPLDVGVIHRIGRDQTAILDRLLAAVTDEYTRELEDRPRSAEERRAERIRRLLAGEPLDPSGLEYEFDAWHLGVLAAGSAAAEALRALAAAHDRRLLLAQRDKEAVWAWLGGRKGFRPDEVKRLVSCSLPRGVKLALGEPGHGLTGWRLTHQQARAALPIALRTSENAIRYADVALLASILQDDLLATSLRELYLKPLERDRDGGETARQTLRTYFAADRNISSAGAVLGVSRRTVANRLRDIEERLGRTLGDVAAEIEITLRADELDRMDR